MTRQAPQLSSIDEAVTRLRPIIERIRAVWSSEAWLVGGVVRDAFLGRSLDDVDIVVAGDPGEAARALAPACNGTPFPLSDRHGCWRIAASPDVGHVDICERRGASIEEDLALRDLTINALAVDCINPSQIIDLGRSMTDLAQGIVRAVSEQALDDDPLRLLRVVRFAHTLGFEVEQHTQAWVRARAGQVARASGERIFAELGAMLDAPEQRRGMRLLDELGLLAVILPELDACRGISQSRFHHLDVFEHTLAVLDNTEDIVAAPEFHLGDPGVPVAPWSEHELRVMQLAALLHDAGKPATRGVHPVTGSVTFVGHDTAGLACVDAVCDRWGASNRLRSDVKLLVRTHLALGMMLHGPGDVRARWRFLRSVEPCAAPAVVLSVADRLATAGVDDRRRWVRAHIELARWVWAEHWHEQVHGRPEPLLDGRAITRIAGVAPGPAIGHLVRALAEEQAVGAVRTEQEARAFVERAAHAAVRT